MRREYECFPPRHSVHSLTRYWRIVPNVCNIRREYGFVPPHDLVHYLMRHLRTVPNVLLI